MSPSSSDVAGLEDTDSNSDVEMSGPPPGRRGLDWPLSREEKKACTIAFFERDVWAAERLLRAKDEALGAMAEEIKVLRRLSAASTALDSVRMSLDGGSDAFIGECALHEDEDVPQRRPLDRRSCAERPAEVELGACADVPPPWPEPPRCGPPPLPPSLRGTEAMKRGDVGGGIWPVQEFRASGSPVACLCFGRERFHAGYILLAVGFGDGDVLLCRLRRTEMEKSMLLDANQMPISTSFSWQSYWGEQDEDSPMLGGEPGGGLGHIPVHRRLRGGHSGAVTSLTFSPSEEALVTVAADNGVCFWDADTGNLLQKLADCWPVVAAMFVPSDPKLFVTANAHGVLRVVDTLTCTVLQRQKLREPATALTFDATGAYLLAGDAGGCLRALSGCGVGEPCVRDEVQVAFEPVLRLAALTTNSGLNYVVACTRSSICVVECTYCDGGVTPVCLSVHQSWGLPPAGAPTQAPACCGSFVGPGFVVCGMEDGSLAMRSVAGGDAQPSLRHHGSAVRAVATNRQDTLLASGDAAGCVVLWRRLAFD